MPRLMVPAALWTLLMMSSVASAQLIIAHRGASYDAPENTLAAFRLAWEQGADGIEGDFYLSKDGEVVCIHDATTKRTAGENLVVADATLAELRKLDVGAWKNPRYKGERIATLAEVLEGLPAGKLIYIELKVGPEIVAPVKRILENSSVKPEQIAIIAFNRNTIREVREQLPHLRAHWLTGYKKSGDSFEPSAEQMSATLKSSGATGLGSHANRDAFTPDVIAQLRADGMKEYHVWTINDAETAKFYQALEPFSITTDRPGDMRKWLAK